MWDPRPQPSLPSPSLTHSSSPLPPPTHAIKTASEGVGVGVGESLPRHPGHEDSHVGFRGDPQYLLKCCCLHVGLQAAELEMVPWQNSTLPRLPWFFFIILVLELHSVSTIFWFLSYWFLNPPWFYHFSSWIPFCLYLLDFRHHGSWIPLSLFLFDFCHFGSWRDFDFASLVHEFHSAWISLILIIWVLESTLISLPSWFLNITLSKPP